MIVVKDIQKARHFYKEVLDLDVIADFGANITLTGGIGLQTLDTWKDFIRKQDEELVFKNNVCELYFEEDDIERFTAALSQRDDIEYVHPLLEHTWGQRVVRFYDLDGHIIEVGERLDAVVKRFIADGLTVEGTAERMDVSISFIQSCLD